MNSEIRQLSRQKYDFFFIAIACVCKHGIGLDGFQSDSAISGFSASHWSTIGLPHPLVPDSATSMFFSPGLFCFPQLDYVDLYLIHWPVVTNPNQSSPPKPEDFGPVELEATWHEMEKLEADGKARAIGVSNYSVKKMETILKSALMKPAVNQVEVHPGWRNDKIIKFCHEKGIHVTGEGRLRDSRGSGRKKGGGKYSCP